MQEREREREYSTVSGYMRGASNFHIYKKKHPEEKELCIGANYDIEFRL